VTASLTYLKALKNQVPDDEKKRIYADLVKHCRLDTLAEVRLLEELYRVAS
jgi:hypothetical protein